jgi:hypothetical protein
MQHGRCRELDLSSEQAVQPIQELDLSSEQAVQPIQELDLSSEQAVQPIQELDLSSEQAVQLIQIPTQVQGASRLGTITDGARAERGSVPAVRHGYVPFS